MYARYFGLHEPSFAITPDPQYLFLSAQHREALAHLLYGASDSGGFVLLTGEVGTGKTTICRAFLEQLPEGVEVALVLNSALTADELISAICDEFGVAVADDATAKQRLDQLNRFLFDCYREHRRPVLIIDEAQNLAPQVLEQVRLLTNLETAKHKLLQIFLIGQPELRDLLATPQLRQLNQRITARFHLDRLNRRETAAYLRHRLAVGGVERPLFSQAAIRQVYRYSKGIPRLINLICDRALLGAAVEQQAGVNARIVNKAARELIGSRALRPPPQRLLLGVSMMFIFAVGIGLGQRFTFGHWIAAQWPLLVSIPGREHAELSPAEPATMAVPATPHLISTVQSDAPLMDDLSQLAELTRAWPEALAQLVTQWGLIWPQDRPPAPCPDVQFAGLRCEVDHGRWHDLRRFDRPVALTIEGHGQAVGMLVIIALDEEFATVATASTRYRVPIAELDKRWSGEYRLLWRAPPGGERLIGRNASTASRQWLHAQLAHLGDEHLRSKQPADTEELIEAVRRFQEAHDLTPDGIAGPRTLIVLENQRITTDH